jgi:hypothetical protein
LLPRLLLLLASGLCLYPLCWHVPCHLLLLRGRLLLHGYAPCALLLLLLLLLLGQLYLCPHAS